MVVCDDFEGFECFFNNNSFQTNVRINLWVDYLEKTSMEIATKQFYIQSLFVFPLLNEHILFKD